MTLFIDVIVQTSPWQSYAGRSVALRFFIVGQLQVYFLTQAYRQKRGYAFLNLYVNRFVGGGLVVNQFWANYACPGITSNTSVCCVGKCWTRQTQSTSCIPRMIVYESDLCTAAARKCCCNHANVITQQKLFFRTALVGSAHEHVTHKLQVLSELYHKIFLCYLRNYSYRRPISSRYKHCILKFQAVVSFL